MDRFSMPLPKLLYLVYEMHSKGTITMQEKDKLKGKLQTAMVVTEDEHLTSLLETYVETGDKEALEKDILKVLRTQTKPRAPSPIAVPKREVVDEEESSSPLGTFLHERKKHQHAEMELHLNLCEPVPGMKEDAVETDEADLATKG